MWGCWVLSEGPVQEVELVSALKGKWIFVLWDGCRGILCLQKETDLNLHHTVNDASLFVATKDLCLTLFQALLEPQVYVENWTNIGVVADLFIGGGYLLRFSENA